jgi:hypothetical protein
MAEEQQLSRDAERIIEAASEIAVDALVPTEGQLIWWTAMGCRAVHFFAGRGFVFPKAFELFCKGYAGSLAGWYMFAAALACCAHVTGRRFGRRGHRIVGRASTVFACAWMVRESLILA